jgi:ATP-binding cassette, subfamily B, bacterial
MESKTKASSKSRGKTWIFISDSAQAIHLVWMSHPSYVILVAVLTVISGCVPVVQLWISKLLIDSAAGVIQMGIGEIQKSQVYSFFALVGFQAGLFFLSSVLTTSQETLHPLLGDLLSNQVKLNILNKANGLDVSFFEDDQFYNKLQNAYQEASYRPLDLMLQLFSLTQNVITLSSMVFLLLRLNWVILLLILISALPGLIVHSRYGFLNYWLLRSRAPELRKQNYYGMLLTSSWFIKEVRVFHLEDYFLSLYKSLFGKFFGENRKLIFKRYSSSMLASAGSILGWFLAAGYVVLQVVARTISIGDFAMYTQAISVTQGQIQTLMSGVSDLYSNALFLRNLFEFLSLPARDLSVGQSWSEPIEEIEFRDVSFSYPGKNRVVLDKINFTIRRGQALALVGKNGAGKTTVVKLLCRLYEPTTGKIFVNGKDIADYSPCSFQEQIAVLFQDYGTYYLTARENIGVGRVANLNDIKNIEIAAKRSGAKGPIEALPNKYETMLGKWFDEGAELSGGEWQKVALARGFFRQGGVLILDEPTAALDAEAEFDVFRNLAENRTDKITLLISHRFSTVRMADHILVLEDGKCTEAGSHQELIKACGHYAYLFNLQARGYD